VTDVPFVISASFSKTVQTAPFESEKAEISAQCKVDEGADAQTTIEATMSMVRRQVMIALGKETGTLVAVSTDPAKRGPGRPKKDTTAETEKTVEKAAPQVVPDKEVEKAAQPPKVEQPEDDDFGDPAEKVSEITDKMLQEACGAASKKPGMDAAKVKKLFNTKYGTTLVAKIKPQERADFLKDLEAIVKENAPKE